jgi:Predicted transcription factor, homolog of eukaryotic MBF1
MATFGERFKKERLRRGLTQERLANKFFLDKSSISKYENNKQIPETDTLQALAKFFDCSIDYLLGKTEIRNSMDLFNGPGSISKEVINKFMEQYTKNSFSENNLDTINDFSFIIEDKLREANLYNENMTYEEKVELANKILNILKIIENK